MYIELFLLDNFLMDCLLLRIASAFLSWPIPPRRMVITALAGACCAWASLFFPPLLSLPGKAILGLLFALAFPLRGRRAYMRAAASVFISAFLVGGFAFALAFCFGGSAYGGMLVAGLPMRTALLTALGATFAPAAIRRLRARCAQRAFRGQLTVRVNGCEYRFDALLDTGNGLTEPLSGKPVAVAYLPELIPLANVPIPTATVEGTGMLYALRPEYLAVNGNAADALLAICPQPLRGAQALLPPALYEQMQTGTGGRT